MHLNLDSRVVSAPPSNTRVGRPDLPTPCQRDQIHGFRWVPINSLLHHEKIRENQSSALMTYLESSNDAVAPAIPAIVACSRTNVIIDGHHRTTVLTRMGFIMAPVVFIDYAHEDILVSPDPDNTISKQDVIDVAMAGSRMEPKNTAHCVRAGNGSCHPIVTLSPNCSLPSESVNLTGGWSYTPQMARVRQQPNVVTNPTPTPATAE